MLRPADHAVTVAVEVPFHHVDLLRVVWHGHYLAYFELARTALLRSVDLDVADVDRLGFRLVVVESHSRHVAPLRYGDRFCCSAWFACVECALKVCYLLWNPADDRRIAKGYTVLAILDGMGQLLLRTPDAIRQRLPL